VPSDTDAILREQVKLAFEHLPTMQVTSVGVALVLSYAVRHVVSRANIVAWLLLVVVIAGARIVAYYRFMQQRDGLSSGRTWANIYLGMALGSGTLWGLSAFIIFPAGHADLIAMFVLVVASLSAATTVSHSSIKLAPTLWAGPALLLYAARCVAEGGEAESTIAVLIVLYLVTILRYSFTQHATVSHAVAIKFENLALLDEVRRVNDELTKDITARKRAEQERERLVSDLTEALAQVKTLRGFIPICAWCKKVRDDQGYWHAVEVYVRERSEVEFSHGVCPACLARIGRGEDDDDDDDDDDEHVVE
jgi:hypothetical protein